VLAVALVATFTMGEPGGLDSRRRAFANEGWDAVVRAFGR